MKTVQLTIGHNVGSAPTFTTMEICGYVSQYLHVRGFTAFVCFGMWDGETEESTRIEIAGLTDDESEKIRELVPTLAQALNQQAIMFEVRADRVEFIERETIAAIRTA